MRDQQHPDHPGLLASIADVAKNALGLLLNRIELAALELSQVRTSVFKLMLAFAIGIIAAWFAIAFGSVVMVILLWPFFGWTILLILAAAFSLIALGIALYIWKICRSDQLSLPTTLTELRHDRDALL